VTIGKLILAGLENRSGEGACGRGLRPHDAREGTVSSRSHDRTL